LAALALPKLGPRNIAALWGNGLAGLLDGPLSAFDEALHISMGKAHNGIAFTTVLLALQDGGKGGIFPMHVLRDQRKDSTLIVGEAIAEPLKDFLKDAKIEFVARTESNARTKVQTFLNRLLIQAPAETERLLVTSFFHRNGLAGMIFPGAIDKLDSLKMADLLVRQDVLAERPVHATRLNEARKVQQYLEQGASPLAVPN
jgi:hypothetical protein